MTAHGCLNAFRIFTAASMILLASCSRTAVPSSPDQDFQPGQDAAPLTVVFVHGVLGDSVKTFGETPAKGWPSLLAQDTSIAGRPMRVLSVGYASLPIGSGSNISEIATRLLVKLKDKGIFEQQRKVAFVTHSMGGLVVKRMLVQMAAESPFLFSNVAGVFFLATPAGGSDLASLTAWVSGNPQFENMRPVDVNTFLQTIEDDWQSVLRKRTATKPYPKVFCAYEKIGVGPGKVVVPRSASQSGCDETPIAFDVDHIRIAKPSSPSDEIYEYVARRLSRVHRDEYLPLTLTTAVTDPLGTAIAEPIVLKTRDAYAVHVTASKKSWLYVYSQDSTGKIERYFPSVAGGSQTEPALSFRIPSDSGKSFVLDSNVGIERLFIFATAAQDKGLAELYGEVAKAGTESDGRRLEGELIKRGATVASNASSTNGKEVARFNPGSIGSEAAASLLIEHR